MRLLLLSLYYPPARAYGGPLASAEGLAGSLAREGHALRVLTTNADGAGALAMPRGWVGRDQGVEARYCVRWCGEFVAPGLLAHLPAAIAWADLAYAWGVLNWTLPFASLLARLTGRRLVISPRGMLFPDALVTRAGRKSLFLSVLRVVLPPGAVFHATSQAEVDAIRLRFPRAPIVLAPNGVETPQNLPVRERAGIPYLLFLGRLHPHKQVEGIIDAFARCRSAASPAIELRIAGTGDEAYQRVLRDRVTASGLEDRVRFEGHVEGEAKARLLAHAQGLVLASRSESFGLVVAEALAHGTPCVVTRTAPWTALDAQRCGFCVDDSIEALAAGIGRLMSLSEGERRAMGARGRAWMQRDFSWPQVTRRLLEGIEAAR